MSAKIQAVRGMNDLLPETIHFWHEVEKVLRKVAWQYGYQEIRTPLLEKTSLFSHSIGDQTDIVEKEMYTFSDAGEESLTLRPEATASTVRACIQHGLLHNRQQRFWYMGPMFRRERPQKGRYRQFHQFGIEAFGWPGPDIDAEIIRVGERIWKEIGIDHVELQINTLGSDNTRNSYRNALKAYFSDHIDLLDEDSLRRLERNPLRILDSKNPAMQELVEDAPVILDYLDDSEKSHFDQLCENLEIAGISYRVNSGLVRGLDYYTSTVYEWTTDQLGAQSAICAGGRYDSLVENRGGQSVPAIGFAMGIERLIELAVAQGELQKNQSNSIYVVDITACSAAGVKAISEKIRDAGNIVIDHCGGGKLKSQLKRADQSGARIAIIVGDAEVAAGVVQVKHLRENIESIELAVAEIVPWINKNIQ